MKYIKYLLMFIGFLFIGINTIFAEDILMVKFTFNGADDVIVGQGDFNTCTDKLEYLDNKIIIDCNSNTIHLNNVENLTGIKINMDTAILDLKGKNKITTDSGWPLIGNYENNLTISGSGSLEINSDVNAIRNFGSVTIKTTVSLKSNYTSITTIDKLLLDNANVNIRQPDDEAEGHGITDVGDLIIKDSTLDIKSPLYAIVFIDNLLIEGDSNLNFDSGKMGVWAGGNITISGGNININNASCGLYAVGEIIINDGNIKIVEKNPDVYLSSMDLAHSGAAISCIVAGGKISINGGYLDLKSDPSVPTIISYGGHNNITIPSNYEIIADGVLTNKTVSFNDTSLNYTLVANDKFVGEILPDPVGAKFSFTNSTYETIIREKKSTSEVPKEDVKENPDTANSNGIQFLKKYLVLGVITIMFINLVLYLNKKN